MPAFRKGPASGPSPSLMRTFALSVLALTFGSLRAEEGMWTFDHPPLQAMQARYGFTPDPAWLEHVRLSALRFPGGSGAFISPDGLVLTNHHVGLGSIQKVSDAAHNLVEKGFVAPGRDQEIPVPGLVLRSLVSQENVTELLAAGPKRVTDLIQERTEKTGLSWEAVSLYQGGETWLYGYRVFRDVRLVMAPESGVAAFGGDWDNFTFPRHDLDFSLFRVYENGQPYHPGHFIKWAERGIRQGEMTLTAGHPGRTSRLETYAQMEHLRREVNPLLIRILERRKEGLKDFARRSPTHALKVSSELMAAGNFLKVYCGEREGLANGAAMGRIQTAERELRAKAQADPHLNPVVGSSWDRIQEALRQQGSFLKEEMLFHGRYRSLLRGPLERALEIRRGRSTLALRFDRELEAALLEAGLADTLEFLGAQHPLVISLLGKRSPREAARQAIQGTRIDETGFANSPEANRDPLLLMAEAIDPLERKVAERQASVDEILADHNARIARARFAVRGKADYPDATFTLRLSYGSVETYPQAGTLVQPFTTLGGLFDRAEGWGPQAEEGAWALPERWLKARTGLDLSTPYNFISSNDIIGGNSGSPVLNRQGELVGLAFDGNLASIPGRFYYDGTANRCIALDGRAILEALRKVYCATHLAKEILGDTDSK